MICTAVNTSATDVPIATARRCGGVPLTIRQINRPAVASATTMIAMRPMSLSWTASGTFDVIARPFSGHASRQPEIEPPAPRTGSSEMITAYRSAIPTADRMISFAKTPSRRPVGNVRISRRFVT